MSCSVFVLLCSACVLTMIATKRPFTDLIKPLLDMPGLNHVNDCVPVPLTPLHDLIEDGILSFTKLYRD